MRGDLVGVSEVQKLWLRGDLEGVSEVQKLWLRGDLVEVSEVQKLWLKDIYQELVPEVQKLQVQKLWDIKNHFNIP